MARDAFVWSLLVAITMGFFVDQANCGANDLKRCVTPKTCGSDECCKKYDFFSTERCQKLSKLGEPCEGSFLCPCKKDLYCSPHNSFLNPFQHGDGVCVQAPLKPKLKLVEDSGPARMEVEKSPEANAGVLPNRKGDIGQGSNPDVAEASAVGGDGSVAKNLGNRRPLKGEETGHFREGNQRLDDKAKEALNPDR